VTNLSNQLNLNSIAPIVWRGLRLKIPIQKNNSMFPANLVLGTQSWTAEGWEHAFYPKGLDRKHWITYYSGIYNAVEIDSTFYAIPRRSTVQSWRENTRDGFFFAAKMVQTITHEKRLQGVKKELDVFLSTIGELKEKLAVILIQLPYYNKKAFENYDAFHEGLNGFLEMLPKEFRFAVEVRNRQYLQKSLFDTLKRHNIAYTLQDIRYMPPPAEVMSMNDVVTSDFAYCRLIGDREGIEAETQVFDKEVWPREKELADWASILIRLSNQVQKVFAFINNHYSGFAPGTLARLKAAMG